MRGRRLLVGVVAVAIASTAVSIAWAGPSALRSGDPGIAPVPAPAVAAPARLQWSVAWASGQAGDKGNRPQGFPGTTFRNVVHTTIGGPQIRLRLTNRYGTAPTRFGHVTVALSAKTGARRGSTDVLATAADGSVAPGTMRTVRFAGRDEITVPPGADALSDPVALDVPADTDLLVSIWTPDRSGRATYHPSAKQVSFLSPGPADRAADPGAAAFVRRIGSWYYLAGVEVTGAPGTVVALGDSITDGGSSTIGANRRWPDYLAARLAESPLPDYGVANVGMSGNRILLDGTANPLAGRSAQARFGPDVLERPGVRSVVIALGINDIMLKPVQADPEQVIAGLAQLCARARAAGLRVVVATLMPFQGWPAWRPGMEPVRSAVNTWIRSGGGGAFDAMADLDMVMRDWADPAKLRAEYDGGDHLHPNDAGQLAIANAIPLDQL